MECEVILTVNKNGKSEDIKIGNTKQPLTSFKDIRNLLGSLDKEQLENIINFFPSIQEIGDLSISDISENSVGVFTPTELLSDIPQYKNSLRKLRIPKEE